MKASTVAAILVAASRVRAQISVLTGALSKVSDGVQALDNATTSFDIDAIKSRGDALISTISSQRTAVNASKAITIADALGLNGPVQRQNDDFETLVTDLKAKRPQIEKANACKDVHSRITKINDGSLALIEGIIAKVPQEAQSIVRQVATGTTRTLNDAGSAFSESNCKNSGPTTTTSVSTTTPTSTPTETGGSESKKTPIGGIVGGVVGGVAAIGAIGLAAFIFLRRKRQQKLKEERENAVELDTENNSNKPKPPEKDYKELSAEETEKKELSADETARKELCADGTEKKEMCAEETAIHEAPDNARYELE
ncbi:cell wall galactomannoprotein Mp2/allergen F17-like protein [Pochonia chlamydosporia 170]|uniref:Cell wall galactomannoprotein Mp2/allergen F17-like protein n=1 Tax=Pochonia chlamydosporia 170 TaxID=1380566 RepID=A0A179F079_METCM|nr:cell wall galactomannoprotein Mp2/allergen F17-like protein [Pochonia chlamydosporia 170]OAQ58808.1 cell wall galactomannoprotein Mp2/allergen F17-like protein [Pochonia chlamydosporia 170]